MSKKTFFKRIALGVIAAMGVGFLSVPSAQAVRLTNSLTLSSATASTTTFDTASVTLTLRQTSTQDGQDSMTVRVSCDAPTGATCPTLKGYQDASADTLNVNVGGAGVNRGIGVWTNLSGWADSQVQASQSMRSVITVKGEQFPAAGTYTYTIYATGNGGSSDVITGTSTTWTVTVTSPSTSSAGGSAQVFISSDAVTASQNRFNFLQYATGTDSAIVAVRGTAASPTLVGYALLTLRNSAGDTRVAVGSGFVPVQDSVTVTVSGPGTVSVDGGTNKAKSATMSVTNARTGNYTYPSETLTVFSDGTAGVMTITFTKGSTTLATKTVTFTGDPASVVANLSDTYTSLSGTVTLSGQVKDSSGSVLSTGTVYVFSSDTKIAGSVPTTAVFGQTGHRCTTFTGTTSATYRLNCGITLTDTGVVTLTVGDSWTIGASTWTSTPVELTITGNTVASATVAFDKATYTPGERAVITITTKDAAGRLHANGATGTLGRVYSSYTLTGSTSLPFRGTSTSSSDITYSSTLTEYMDTGVETRVVTMPSFGGPVTYTVEHPTFGSTTGAVTVITATATVADPNSAAIAASQAAADAAADAAAEAIDAANAATDAANLAAEAADAATVAAEEARDAADAATAAVEELATQVATLMAALKAQITTLANTVAKIAKKVRA